MVITRTDRISTVIGRDETFIDVFIALSPAFERLRNAGMRKVMSRLVTVEQAARMAGVDTDELVARLNAHRSALGEDTDDRSAPGNGADSPGESTVEGAVEDSAADMRAAETRTSNIGLKHMNEQTDVIREATDARPDALTSIDAASVVELDVRAELRAGREPFSMIMAARRQVPDGGALCVRATFEPVLLYAVMKRQGLEHWTEQLAEDDWRVWFYPPATTSDSTSSAALVATSNSMSAAASNATPAATPPAAAVERTGTSQPDADEHAEDDIVILDVRNLEPPEPMVRTLAALDQLPAGRTLLQINVRVPQFLLPMLEERGFTYEVREQERDLVRVLIRHTT